MCVHIKERRILNRKKEEMLTKNRHTHTPNERKEKVSAKKSCIEHTGNFSMCVFGAESAAVGDTHTRVRTHNLLHC